LFKLNRKFLKGREIIVLQLQHLTHKHTEVIKVWILKMAKFPRIDRKRFPMIVPVSWDIRHLWVY